jgi:hypothetical protein
MGLNSNVIYKHYLPYFKTTDPPPTNCV